jgi:hypothetical protein
LPNPQHLTVAHRTVPLACHTFPGYFLSGSYGWQSRDSA